MTDIRLHQMLTNLRILCVAIALAAILPVTVIAEGQKPDFQQVASKVCSIAIEQPLREIELSCIDWGNKSVQALMDDGFFFFSSASTPDGKRVWTEGLPRRVDVMPEPILPMLRAFKVCEDTAACSNSYDFPIPLKSIARGPHEVWLAKLEFVDGSPFFPLPEENSQVFFLDYGTDWLVIWGIVKIDLPRQPTHFQYILIEGGTNARNKK